MPRLIDPDIARQRLLKPEIEEVGNRIGLVLDTGSSFIEAQLDTSFDQAIATDIFRYNVSENPMRDGRILDLMLANGFLTSQAIIIKIAERLSDLSESISISLDTVFTNRERGIISIADDGDDSVLYDTCFVSIEYQFGFTVEGDSFQGETYVDTQVPSWLKQAAILYVNEVYQDIRSGAEKKVPKQTQRSASIRTPLEKILSNKIRHSPLALMRINL